MGKHLGAGNRPSYDQHITSGQVEDVVLLGIMAKLRQLAAAYLEERKSLVRPSRD